jgi:hypothetical protein
VSIGELQAAFEVLSDRLNYEGVGGSLNLRSRQGKKGIIFGE